MKRKIRVMLAWLALMTVTFATGGRAMDFELISVDAFLAQGGYTRDQVGDEEALTRIENFIQAREFDDYIMDEIPEEVVRNYIRLLIDDAPISYAWMLDETTIDVGQVADLDAIRSLAVAIVNDAAVTTLVVDFDRRMVYIDPVGFIINDVGYARQTLPLSDEACARAVELLEGTGFDGMSHDYEGDPQSRVTLAMSFEEGVARYSASGTAEEAKALWDVSLALVRLFQ